MTDVDEPLAVDPTIEVDTGLSPAEVRLCPGCGRPEPSWRGSAGRGFLFDDGHTYCCAGCAQQSGCTCA